MATNGIQNTQKHLTIFSEAVKLTKLFMVIILSALISNSLKAQNNDIEVMNAAIVHINRPAYFFVGKFFYTYEMKTDKVDKVAFIKDNWKGVPDNLDAKQSPINDQYNNYEDNIILFYKKSVEYVFDISLNRVEN